MPDERWEVDEPVSPAHQGADHAEPPEFRRELWGTRVGFILAAVGSAVGLGNMWRFPYYTAEHGGAAFVLLYIGMTFLIGIPILLAEFAVGRRTRLSPIGALRSAGGRGWSLIGYLFVFAGVLILGYYSVIAGWVTRYAITAVVTGFPEDTGALFGQVSTGWTAAAFHVFFMAATISIVMGGVEKGIERASFIMMPSLFLLIVALAVWAATLAGSGEGYAFYLRPNADELFSRATLAAAAGQAFFSLSLGMGAMLTFASYLSKRESLPREGTIIAFSDFGVAFIAGLVIFPVIFALGLQGAVGESTVGALFISLPGAFAAMGTVGRVIGAIFFIALFIGALTSAISLLEVVTSSVIDEWRVPRRTAAVVAGLVIALIGFWPALNLDALGAMDAVAGDVLLPFGALALSIFVGWLFRNPIEEVAQATGPRLAPLLKVWLWLLRVLAPILLALVLLETLPRATDAVRALFGGGS
jgi:neurotransmitter:Na+ symporter, NSS family